MKPDGRKSKKKTEVEVEKQWYKNVNNEKDSQTKESVNEDNN